MIVATKGDNVRPKLLDLFCCEGGASEGYRRAGFDVYGVDLFEDYSRERYPFPSVGPHADAIQILRMLLNGSGPLFSDQSILYLRDFAAIHASPPCQRHSAGTRAADRSKYPDLIAPTRELLVETGLPYVIENVEGAPLVDPITLCGTMFRLHATDEDGTPLEMWRHRLFESNVTLAAPREHAVEGWETFPMACRHGWFSQQVAGVYGGARRDKHEARNVRHGGYVPASKRVAQGLLGIDWMTWKGMYQSLPPAYTEHIGLQLLSHLKANGRAA